MPSIDAQQHLADARLARDTVVITLAAAAQSLPGERALPN